LKKSNLKKILYTKFIISADLKKVKRKKKNNRQKKKDGEHICFKNQIMGLAHNLNAKAKRNARGAWREQKMAQQTTY
jgi:hypothetical protein